MEAQELETPASFVKRFMPLKGEAARKKIAGDSILFLETEREHWRFPCLMLARYFLHAAQDGGFSKICVLKGPHRHEFKVYDLVRDNFKRFGRHRAWSGPALQSFRMRKDCWLDDRRKLWVMGWKPNPSAKILPARG